jgi:FtsZ-binding cell division protein ZapB
METTLVPTISTENFAAPTARTELNGAQGLDLHQMADSLGADFSVLKRKIEDRGLMERLQKHGYRCLPIGIQQSIQEVSGHSYTREVDSYVLDVNAAKFFVAKYDNETGDAYLAFLISRESTLTQMEQGIENDPDLAIKFADAVKTRALAQLEVRKQTAIAAHVTKMLTASQTNNAALTREAKKLKETLTDLSNQVGDGPQWKTASAMQKARPDVLAAISPITLGKQVKALSIEMGVEIRTLEGPKYSQNVYHASVWNAYIAGRRAQSVLKLAAKPT